MEYHNYIVYNDGRIYGKKTKGRAERFMKQSLNHDGYYRLSLTINGKNKKYFTHKLVAELYVPNPNNFSEVDHIDRDPTNNHYSNLRWCDRSINCQNRNIFKNNICRIKNIRYHKSKNNWEYRKEIRGNKFTFAHKNKNIVLWCKFIYETLPVETGA